MENYYLYLRKSRADQEAELHGEGETLARHEKILLALAKQLNCNITGIYKEVVSGETISSRPEIQKLLSDVEKGFCTGVFVMEVERLARGDTIDQGIISQTFKYSKTKIITPSKTYDPENEFDEEYFEFGLFMSRREYKTINRRIQTGRLASVKEGKYISSIAPYGYDRIKLTGEKGYSLKPNSQAYVIRLIFELYVKGLLDDNGTYMRLGMTRIANHLDQLHIKPLLKETWSRSSISDILKNPVYIGKICWQKRKEIRQVKNGTVIKTRPAAQSYLIVDGLHEPILEKDIFYEAQKLMEKRRSAPVKPNLKLQNPLAGLVYCGKCGNLMTRLGPNKRNVYASLTCQNGSCDNISCPLFLIEQKTLIALESWLHDYEIPLKTDVIEINPKIQLNAVKKALLNRNQELTVLKHQLEKTYTLLEQGIYTTEIFTLRIRTLTESIQHTTTEIKNLEERKNKMLTGKNQKAERNPAAKSISHIYNSLGLAQDKNALLKETIEKIIYLKTERNTRGKLENANFTISIYPRIPKVSGKL